MSYEPVQIHDLEGKFIGYTIRKSGLPKLQSSNIWVEGEESDLGEQIQRLLNDVDIRQFWPSAKDPEVLALLADTNFHPIEYEEVDVVDEEASTYIEKVNPRTGEPLIDTRTGTPQYDEELSNIVTKRATVPKEPSAVVQRVKAACEIIARQRAGLNV